MPPPDAAAASAARDRYLAVGCVTFGAGAVSGSMIAVLLGKLIGDARGCRPPVGLPACDWYVYAFVGMIIGAVTLPFLAIRRLRQKDDAADDIQRG